MKCFGHAVAGILGVLLLCGSGCGEWGGERAVDAGGETVRAVVADFEQWTAFQGRLDAVESEPVVSSISQPTALLMLAPEGAAVEAGDVVAVLDTSSLEASLAALERDLVLAEAEARTLLEAEIPLRRAKVQAELREARTAWSQEEGVGERMGALAEEGLISEGELAAYAARVEGLRARVADVERQARLQEEVVIPGQRAAAEARVTGARRQLELVREQVAGARVTASQAGRVVYLPLHVNGEFRTVREGDTVYRNQEFMRISDLGQVVVRCEVPESRLSRVPAGAEVRVVPDAFPELELRGQVLSVSSVAVQAAGRPAHVRTFTVTVLLEGSDPRLRLGMTVRAHVLSERVPGSVVVPRAWVRHVDGVPTVWRADGGTAAVRLGGGNETHFRIVEGVEAGAVLRRPPAL